MFIIKHKYLFLIAISLLFPLTASAVWNEPSAGPPGGNVGVPVYSAGGVAQTIDSSLTVGAIGTATTLQGSGSAIGVRGTSPQYAVYGDATASGLTNGYAGIFGTAADSDDFAGKFSGGGGIAIQGGAMPTIAVGSYVQAAGGELVSTGGYALGTDVVFNNTNKGLVWQRLDGAWLRGVYVNAGVLTVKGYGAGINFTDQNGNVRMTVSEAGAVAVGGSPVCLQNGVGCPSITTPDLQAVTTAGGWTTNSLDLRGAIANSIGDLTVNDWLDVQWGLKNSTANNGGKLYVSDDAQIAGNLRLTPGNNVEGVNIISSNYSPLVIRNPADTADFLRVNQNGNVGIGITDPSLGGLVNGRFTINSGSDSTQLALAVNGNPRFALNTNNNSSWTMYDYAAGSWTGGITQKSGNLAIGSADPAGYKLHVTGNTYMTGNLTVNGVFSAGADVAEEFSTTGDLEPGTVVVMGSNGYKSAQPATEEYDQSVVGVVSDNASFTMGRVDSPHKAVIAMVGVVKVKVTGYNGAIRRGDLLTTSREAGYAMKAVKPRLGTIIGKALEDWSGQRGAIMALVNLQ